MSAIDTCARCGAAFHCGAHDAAPCACTTLALRPGTLARLAHVYSGCLCLACLREIAADEKAGSVLRPAGSEAMPPPPTTTKDQSLR